MVSRTLLCVDDETSVLRSLKRVLRKEDYRVLTASSGQEGLDILERHEAQVILSDQRMPGMEGSVFLQKVKERYPHTVRVMLSGYVEAHAMLDSINQGEIYRFLPKPWDDEALKVTLRQCFAQHELRRQNLEMVTQIQAQNAMLKQLNDTLEQTVAERTESLRLAQDIVEKLPQPMLGITKEGFVALVNEAARALLSDTAYFFGADMDTFLPPVATEAVARTLAHNTSNGAPLVFPLNGHTIHAQIVPLRHRDGLRGCILIMENS